VSLPDLRPAIRAAGGVLRRGGEYALVHRPKYDDWSLPKGKLNTGESYLRAARREVLEETGHRGLDPVEVGSIGYDTVAGKRKLVRWWSMTATDGEFQPNAEVDEVAWLPGAQAVQRLNYSNDRHVLARALRLDADPTAATVYMVRHARAGEKRRWGRRDSERPLDETGREQALVLAFERRLTPLTRIISSERVRCLQTVEPLAAGLKMRVEIDPRLNLDAGTDDALELLRELAGEAVVISSHREVIGALMRRLASQDIERSGPLRWSMASTWTLQLSGGRVRSAEYQPPPGLHL